jgi:predicted DNA-binding transcriptional regulator YafY
MYYSTSRVLAVLDLLQAHGVMRGEELARRLEVDVRTIRRYVMILRDRGIAVEMKRGRYGGYYLPAGARVPLALTKQEALAVTYGLLSGGGEHFGLGADDGERTLRKLARALPSATRDLVQHLEKTVTFAMPTTVDHAAVILEHLDIMLHAIQAHNRVRMRYRTSAGDVTERIVEPYQAVNRYGYWYLVGYCHLRGGQRVFRLDRVLTAVALPETFQPLEIDALAAVEQAIAQTPRRWEYRIWVNLSPAEIHQRIPSTHATLEPQEHGVILHGFADDLDWLAYVALDLRCDLVILDPPELRTHLLALANYIRAIAEQPAAIPRP